MKILTEPPQSFGSAPRPTVHRPNVTGALDPSMPMRRRFVLVLLLLSFALSLAVLYRAHSELASVPPGDRGVTTADPILP